MSWMLALTIPSLMFSFKFLGRALYLNERIKLVMSSMLLLRGQIITLERKSISLILEGYASCARAACPWKAEIADLIFSMSK